MTEEIRVTVDREGLFWRRWWVRVNGRLVAEFHKKGDAFEMAHRLQQAITLKTAGRDTA